MNAPPSVLQPYAAQLERFKAEVKGYAARVDIYAVHLRDVCRQYGIELPKPPRSPNAD